MEATAWMRNLNETNTDPPPWTLSRSSFSRVPSHDLLVTSPLSSSRRRPHVWRGSRWNFRNQAVWERRTDSDELNSSWLSSAGTGKCEREVYWNECSPHHCTLYHVQITSINSRSITPFSHAATFLNKSNPASFYSFLFDVAFLQRVCLALIIYSI